MDFGFRNAMRQFRDTWGTFLPSEGARDRADDELMEAQHAAYGDPAPAGTEHPMAVETWAHHLGWRVRYDHPSGAVEHGTLIAVTETPRSQQLLLMVLFENAAAPVPVDPEYLWLVRRPVDPERTPIELTDDRGRVYVPTGPEQRRPLPRIGESPPVSALVDQLAEEMRNSTGDVGLDDDGWAELAEVALTFMRSQLVVLIEEWE